MRYSSILIQDDFIIFNHSYIISFKIHLRFVSALALFDLISEVPLAEVTEKFGCNRGFLQALQQQSSTYAGSSTTKT